MTLMKNTAGTKLSPNAKMTTISTVKKVAPILRKPIDVKPASSTSTKGKLLSSPLKSPSAMEKSPIKLTLTKATGAITPPKTSFPTIKKSTTATSTSSAVNTAVSKPNVLKSIPMKSPERKSADVKPIVIKSASMKSPERKSADVKPSVIKSAPMKSPPRKLEEVKKEPSARSLDKLSPVSKLRSKVDSSVNLKPTNTKPSITPVKSVSPVKSILSPKLSVSRDIKPLIAHKSNEIKTDKNTPSTLAKKSTSLVKISKPGTVKVENGVKSKPIITKKVLLSSPRISKSSGLKATLKLPVVPISTTVDKVDELVTPDFVEKIDLCQCTGVVVDKCDNFDCTTNNNFNVAQAFKVAEQLIRIQSTDGGLETIVETCENSTVNWDDVITPCPEPFNGAYDVVKLEAVKLDETAESLNHNAPESCSEVSSTSDTFIESAEDTTNCQQNNSVESVLELEDNVTVDISNKDLNDDENIPIITETSTEWTIVIDEFSPDIHKQENIIHTNETSTEMENSSVIPYKTSYEDSASLSYADVLKKMPKILANSTNIRPPKNDSKLNLHLHTKEYHMLKKVEALHSTNIFFNKIEKDIEHVDFENDDPAEPEFLITRKKHQKKIKHSPKRYMKNFYRDYDYDEDHTDIFITRVWKNIY